eukprot:2460518-Heterocapsa_arctica.AAC.1
MVIEMRDEFPSGRCRSWTTSSASRRVYIAARSAQSTTTRWKPASMACFCEASCTRKHMDLMKLVG